ncbi:MAG TPA: S-methyl-5-thioribose-1-phosphate isomerase, partial [Candidatus Limnocylindrales bacterium]|nr:S-methyl-5-thioribose-1-phosphate isomerase [Candidatus Limnocylindrales bacterium]
MSARLSRPGADAGDDPEGVDLERRRFFRRFASEVATAAASVVGAAQVLQRESAEAARLLLEGEPEGRPAADRRGPAGFRTPFRWEDDRLVLIDQRRLPAELVEVECRTAGEVAQAIRSMVVRGAPAIGQVAAIGLALAARAARSSRPYARRALIVGSANALRNARPTAVNLGWAIDRMLARYRAVGELAEDGEAVALALRAEAEAIVHEATDDHGRLAEYGFEALPATGTRAIELLTHCNTGPLACGQFGTALGVVQVAHHRGRPVHVWVDETRPYLQGARLTTWELAQAGVPHTLIPDAAAGSLLAAGRVDAVLVGADRIAANGDTANKIGTYPLAVLAARHGVPFFVCAPLSSVDPGAPDGSTIPIEVRPADEVVRIADRPIAPPGTEAYNPAFDVTPAELITAIVTEEGVLRPPFGPAIAAALEAGRKRKAAAWWRAAPPEPAGSSDSPAGAHSSADPAGAGEAPRPGEMPDPGEAPHPGEAP